MNNAFKIQTILGQYWLDVVAALAEKDAIIAAKDLEIAKLSPGYMEPEVPTLAKRVEDAVASALTEEEVLLYSKEIESIKDSISAAEVVIKAIPIKVIVDGDVGSYPVLDEKLPVGKETEEILTPLKDG